MNKYAGVWDAIQKLEIVINGTPTGETRNILTDVNIFLRSLIAEPSVSAEEVLKKYMDEWAENGSPLLSDFGSYILKAMESYRSQNVNEGNNSKEDDRLQKEKDVWNLLKWLKANHYLPQTEETLQRITASFIQSQKVNNNQS